MEEKHLTCIQCPMGCQLTVRMTEGEVKSVSGNSCPRGDIYARKEVVNPTRIVTSTVVVEGGKSERVSVKTKTDIPKTMIFPVMQEINRIRVTAPVEIGEVLAQDIAGTGVELVATKAVDQG